MEPAAGGSAKYTVQRQECLREKPVLHSHQTTNVEPPLGYVYMPVGCSNLAELCKELSRKSDRDVYIVSTPRYDNAQFQTNALSHHVNRIGYHFHGDIVEQAMKVVEKVPESQDGTIDQFESIQKMRDIIMELFPRIPEQDMKAIVRRSFDQNGTGRIGNAHEVPWSKRVQLAVVAHIRHNHTRYEELVMLYGRDIARRRLEDVNLAKVLEWRSEDNTGQEKAEFEKYYRELIILDDDVQDEEDDNISGTENNPLKLEDSDQSDSQSNHSDHKPLPRAKRNRLPARDVSHAEDGANDSLPRASKTVQLGLGANDKVDSGHIRVTDEGEEVIGARSRDVVLRASKTGNPHSYGSSIEHPIELSASPPARRVKRRVRSAAGRKPSTQDATETVILSNGSDGRK